ncbi:MAG: OmpA family protein [Sphingomonadaceae bacterium]
MRAVYAAAPAAAAAVAAPLMAAPATARRDEDEGFGMFGTGLATLGVLGLGILGAAIIGGMVGDRGARAPAPASPMVRVAPGPTVPQGAGVVAEVVNGKPQVSVYFDTARADVAPDFAAVAAPIKAWIDTHPGDRLAVSGYNDPRGDAAFNEGLSKNRAQNVAAALAAMGVPDGVIDLEKPADATDTTTSYENARRVDIMVREGA